MPKTAEEMYETVKTYYHTQDIVISTAAVADIQFATHSQKIKKADLHSINFFNTINDFIIYFRFFF